MENKMEKWYGSIHWQLRVTLQYWKNKQIEHVRTHGIADRYITCNIKECRMALREVYRAIK
jgi:hypothetical protein